MAIAGTGLYTSGSIGSVVGISISGAVFQWWTKKGLERTLQGVENGIEVSYNLQTCSGFELTKIEIAQRAFSDVGYVNSLYGPVHRLVVDGYLDGFRAAFCKQFTVLMCSHPMSLTMSP